MAQMFYFFMCTLFSVAVCANGQLREKTFVPYALLSKLSKVIQEDQLANLLKTDSPPKFRPLPGMYSTYMKANFNGRPNTAFWRKTGGYDNNIFASNFVNIVLIEAYLRGKAPAPTHFQIAKTLDILPDFFEKNRPYNNSLMYYRVLNYNEEKDFWTIEISPNFPHIYDQTYGFTKIMDRAKFPEFMDFLDFQAAVGPILDNLPTFPGDLDTAFGNVELGTLLFLVQEKYPSLWTKWSIMNRNISSAFYALKEYSYRPFSGDRNSKSTDPKTYFALRHFLQHAKETNKDVALVFTWSQSLEEQRWQYDLGTALPGRVNDVCIGVIANIVYGITSSIVSGMMDSTVLEDPDLATIYQSSSEMLAYMMETNMTSRPDLTGVYYQSSFQIEWFISRTLVTLEDALTKGPLPSQLMEAVHQRLRKTLREEVTPRLLSVAQPECDGSVFYEEILGLADVTEDGTPVKSGEDRIYSTALAVNTLINIWTFMDPQTGNLLWNTDTSDAVKSTVDKAILWLVRNTFGHYIPGGSMFGAYFADVNRHFPINRYEFYNGTAIDDLSFPPSLETVMAMEGYVQPEKYAAMLEQRWFGDKPDLNFHGFNYNLNQEFYTYWECQPFTYSVTLLALSQYKNIQ